MDATMECVELTKRYAGTLALDHINLSLRPGRIVGLLGPNGSGKTTLIKLANGLLTPTSGELKIDGEAPGVHSKQVVSYLPERSYLSDWMRVRDVISIFRDFYSDFDEYKAVDMLRALGLEPSLRIKTLSKGNKEKVQLVTVMSRRAKLYLLDEPIGGVDPAARDFILSTIISNYQQDATVLISTHLIADIERVLDDIIFLKNGKVLRSCSADELREAEGKSVDEVFREVFKC